MGVHGLWPQLEPSGRVVPLSTLCADRLITDPSITNTGSFNTSSSFTDPLSTPSLRLSKSSSFADASGFATSLGSSSSSLFQQGSSILPTADATPSSSTSQPKNRALPDLSAFTKNSSAQQVSIATAIPTAAAVAAPTTIRLPPGVGLTFTEEQQGYIRDSKELLPIKEMELGYHPLKVAVDASIWLHNDRLDKTEGAGPNPIIRTIFYRLVRLLKLGIQPVFVFDSRPNAAYSYNHSIAQFPINCAKFRQLVELFRFQVVEAAEYAEAECARLNAYGVVDAVLSDDGDSLLFGAKRVIRNWSGDSKAGAELLKAKNEGGGARASLLKGKKRGMEDTEFETDSETEGGNLNAKMTPLSKKKQKVHHFGIGTGLGKDYVEVFTADGIREQLGVDRNGLILAALLGGSDFDLSGAHSIGIKRAFQIAAGGYGTDIIEASMADDTERLDNAKDSLVRELQTNSRKLMGRRLTKATLPPDWPNPDVLSKFAYPNVTVTKPAIVQQIHNELEAWSEPVSAPDVNGIAEFCVEHFGWGPEVVKAKMNGILGAALRMRRLRIEAHRAAKRGEVEEQVAGAEKDARRRKNVLVANASMGKSLGVSSGVGGVEGDVTSTPTGKNTRITDFFTVKKQSAQPMSPTILPLKRKKSITGAEVEAISPLNSSFCTFAAESPLRHHASQHFSHLIEGITRRRVSKFGVDELRIVWSKPAMAADEYTPPSPPPSESSSGNAQQLGTPESCATPKLATEWDEEDDWEEWRLEQAELSKKGGGKVENTEWVETALVRAVAPKLYCEYLVVEEERQFKKTGVRATMGGLAKNAGGLGDPLLDTWVSGPVSNGGSPMSTPSGIGIMDGDVTPLGGTTPTKNKRKQPQQPTKTPVGFGKKKPMEVVDSPDNFFGHDGPILEPVHLKPLSKSTGFDSSDDEEATTNKKRRTAIKGTDYPSEAHPPKTPRKRGAMTLEEHQYKADPVSPSRGRGLDGLSRRLLFGNTKEAKMGGSGDLFGAVAAGSGAVSEGSTSASMSTESTPAGRALIR
ncbi:hypothetical protein HDV05_006554 [Chytridiales sp. JEL 0842]|nr:hypothetical protein HDV05_006554 [Chytridiales sp. JEL 0842]